MPKRTNVVLQGVIEELQKMRKELTEVKRKRRDSNFSDSSCSSEESKNEETHTEEKTDSLENEDISQISQQNKENIEVIEKDNLDNKVKDISETHDQLDMEVLEILGEDPSLSQAIKVEIHPSLTNRWEFLIQNGVKEEEKKLLLKKYSRKHFLDAVKFNPEIALTMSQSANKREDHFMEVQQLAGSALIAIGAVLKNVLEEKDGIDKLGLIEGLTDAGKMLANLHNSQTKARKAFILPVMNKNFREILEKTKTDEFLFGKSLSEKLKEIKPVEKVVQNIKVPLSTPG
ncbi:uncharacterized protein [Prorops nasuta]|uniref:uncharacterized protein n=1 Tax=Prorops nasuta TaxID=863751 RepID=UPI0034CFCC75